MESHGVCPSVAGGPSPRAGEGGRAPCQEGPGTGFSGDVKTPSCDSAPPSGAGRGGSRVLECPPPSHPPISLPGTGVGEGPGARLLRVQAWSMSKTVGTCLAKHELFTISEELTDHGVPPRSTTSAALSASWMVGPCLPKCWVEVLLNSRKKEDSAFPPGMLLRPLLWPGTFPT